MSASEPDARKGFVSGKAEELLSSDERLAEPFRVRHLTSESSISHRQAAVEFPAAYFYIRLSQFALLAFLKLKIGKLNIEVGPPIS